MMSNKPITPDNTLIVVALEDELPTHMVPGWNVLYTGVGKVNAAIAATEAVLQAQPIHLINYGTGHMDLGGAGVSLGTGDHFVTTPPELMTDIVDMEAYALAKVARLYEVHFQCWKYISDNANDDAADHWAENVAKGARAFVEHVIAPLKN
jgi:adenosylhomocysteine nucleosidase